MLSGRDPEERRRRYSECKFALLSVKQSTIEHAGLGCFAEKLYRPNDVITLYLGNTNTHTSAESRHTEFPYVCVVGQNIHVNIDDGGKALLLGGHKINDLTFQHGKMLPKTVIGRPKENNAYMVGIYVMAKKQILKGNEIFLDYTANNKVFQV